MTREQLVMSVKLWWESTSPCNVELVNYPISFFPIALRHQADLTEVEDRRYKVALADDRQFYRTTVMEPVYIPDENNADGYIRHYGFGKYPVQLISANMMWQRATRR